MPTADATLLPPPFSSPSSSEDRGSARHLEDVGVETILGAMIEVRRRSQPSFAAIDLEAIARDESDDADDTDPGQPSSRDESPASSRSSRRSEVFLKAR